MRISYLLLADSVNLSGDKVNALGIGVRQFQTTALPAVLSGWLLSSVELAADELMQYPLKLHVTLPSGKRKTIIDDEVGPDEPRGDVDPALPISLGVQISLAGYVVEEAGIHRFRLEVGRKRADYAFRVLPADPATG
jgi:hypothetical protein